MNTSFSIKILPMEQDHIIDINKTNEPFAIFGKLKPLFMEDKWSFEEELFETTHYITFPDDHLDWKEYIDNDSKIIFLAYRANECVGQIRLKKDWNKFCYIE
ncbi:MAG: GNAT family N-acetyltransferase, partial [Gorillibacterium sp.]|nr:GNAT family N-acetyltransferase [Gorillibacterium sp.]